MSFSLFSSNIEREVRPRTSLAEVALSQARSSNFLNVRAFSALRLRSRRALSSYSCRAYPRQESAVVKWPLWHSGVVPSPNLKNGPKPTQAEKIHAHICPINDFDHQERVKGADIFKPAKTHPIPKCSCQHDDEFCLNNTPQEWLVLTRP